MQLHKITFYSSFLQNHLHYTETDLLISLTHNCHRNHLQVFLSQDKCWYIHSSGGITREHLFKFVVLGHFSCKFRAVVAGPTIVSSANISLSVLGPPVVKLSDLSITVIEKTSFQLTCEAFVPNTGHPAVCTGVDFTWEKDGIFLQKESKILSFNQHNSYISVKFAVHTDVIILFALPKSGLAHSPWL